MPQASSDDQRYVADLLALGVQVTQDNRLEYLHYAESVCRGMASGYSAAANVTYIVNGNHAQNDASAIVVSAINVYCPQYNAAFG
jgi:hypothetical protein